MRHRAVTVTQINCYILTGSANGHFASHLWDLVRSNSFLTAHTYAYTYAQAHTPLNFSSIATIRANASLNTLKSNLRFKGSVCLCLCVCVWVCNTVSLWDTKWKFFHSVGD